jgi:hypothetical protein
MENSAQAVRGVKQAILPAKAKRKQADTIVCLTTRALLALRPIARWECGKDCN